MSTPDFIWNVRAQIYAHFVATARAPLAADLARHFGRPVGEIEAALGALDAQHALFLEPGTHTIRIANPFSAVPTGFEVEAFGRNYWANCAWDAFGIPAALHAPEAVIRAQCAHSGAPLTLRLAGGEVVCAEEVIHFLVPFDRWYEDMVFT